MLDVVEDLQRMNYSGDSAVVVVLVES